MTAAELTLHEAADQLGVHYMTAYRYVRLGVLAAAKTGGTWRVSQADVDGFRDAAVPPIGGGRRRAPWAERLQARLIAGDARGAWGVVEAALAAGVDLDEIYLDVLSPAMVAIGEGWRAGELDVAVEHRASGIAMRIIGRLGPRFVRRGRTRGAVIVGSPPGERHSLPVAMLADIVRGGGWDVSDLGADVPVVSLVHAANDTPDLLAVGLSIITPECLKSAAVAFTALRAALPEVLLVAGGSAVDGKAGAGKLGADAYAGGGAEFLTLLEDRRAQVRRASDDGPAGDGPAGDGPVEESSAAS
jgi:excisionase family DNA binding protein